MAASPSKSKCCKRSSPLRWLKPHQRRPNGQSLEAGHQDSRKKSPNHYEDLLRVQIAAVSEAPSELRIKWRPKFMNFLRSPKVSPSSKDTNKTDEEKCEQISNENRDNSELKASPSAGAAGSLTTGENPMSTTAHLLSLLDPEDLKHFHKRIKGYDDHHHVVRVSPVHQVTKIMVQPTSAFTFQIVGNNGNKLMEQILVSKGWLHLPNAPQSDVKCLWVESLILFSIWDFKEGAQRVELNHLGVSPLQA